VAEKQGTSRKKIAGWVAAVGTATAGLATFLTNVTTIADFFKGGEVSAGAASSSATAGPRTRVVPPMDGSGVTPTPYEPGESRQSVPDPFLATWTGIVFQRGGPSTKYPVEIELAGGRPGEQIARVRYDTLDCGGVWRLQTAWAEVIRSTESIQSGRSHCEDTVTVTLSMQPDGQVYYEFLDEEGRVGQGILHKS
jgi:hypothetical protein